MKKYKVKNGARMFYYLKHDKGLTEEEIVKKHEYLFTDEYLKIKGYKKEDE